MKTAFCGTIKEGEDIIETLVSIKNQSVQVDDIIVTHGKNIAIGRNNYLKKVKADIIFTFDSGCVYEKDYVKKMLKAFDKDTDIVMGIVLPQKPKNLIQEFCSLRLPQYFRFDEKDWEEFVPSNRQVAFRKRVIKKLGLLPEHLSRSDDTFWYGMAKDLDLKFKHCQAFVYWEMKKSIKSYLKTVYQDSSYDLRYNIKPTPSVQRINPMIFPYGVFISFLAMITKIWSHL